MKNNNSRILTVLSLMLIFLPSLNSLFAQGLSYRTVAVEAEKKQSVADAISYISETLPKVSSQADRRAVYYFLGSLQEQSGLFDEARVSYISAAAISDVAALSRSNEQLVLDAVRCALSSGDFQKADAYLASALKNSSDSQVQAYVRLYGVWSRLCRISERADLAVPIAALRSYAGAADMAAVRPQVLFTLWYLTGEQAWADALRKNYPKSLETGTINGTVRLLPAPFWYFVPHNEIADSAADGSGEKISIEGESKTQQERGPTAETVKMQLGLFRERKNAETLSQRVGERGFKPYITTETRPSGTTYFLVLVDDPDGSVATRLRSAGFECYRYE